MSDTAKVLIFLAVMAGLTLLVLASGAGGNLVPFLVGMVLMTIIGALHVSHWSERVGPTLRMAGTWGLIVVGATLVYLYKDDLADVRERFYAEIDPGYAAQRGDSMVLRADESGHFHVDAMVTAEGPSARIPFMVDTGATTVALSRDDAIAAGIDVDSLNYNIPVSTANGVAFKARVALREIRIGTIRQRNVVATVSREGLDTSLLGMNFLNRLESFEVRGGEMILHP